MGQKVNPHGARVGVILDWSTKWYAGKKDFSNNLIEDHKLREMLKDACAKKGIRLYIPAPILCTDNAAMIGCAAYYQYQERGADDMFLDAFANLDLENS